MQKATQHEKKPWDLHRGAASLWSLIAKQQEEVIPTQQLDFKVIFEHTTKITTERAPDVMGLHCAPDDVRTVSVLLPRRGAKRKAKAQPALAPVPTARVQQARRGVMRRQPGADNGTPEEGNAEEVEDKIDGNEDVDLPSEQPESSEEPE